MRHQEMLGQRLNLPLLALALLALTSCSSTPEDPEAWKWRHQDVRMERDSLIHEAQCEDYGHQWVASTSPRRYNSSLPGDYLIVMADIEKAKRRCMRTRGFYRLNGRDS